MEFRLQPGFLLRKAKRRLKAELHAVLKTVLFDAELRK